tara:strand:+ start:407 stop:553 length:147 start_codon:yes stop_codon:yes gene_type:complete
MAYNVKITHKKDGKYAYRLTIIEEYLGKCPDYCPVHNPKGFKLKNETA